MNLAPQQKFMIDLLTDLLEQDEALEAPFYGCIEKIGKQRHNWFCYIGLTKNVMQVAIMNIWDVSKATWVTRIPLDIKSVVVKKALTPRQIIIQVKFHEGNDVRIRAYKKVLAGDLGNQESNIERFIERISLYAVQD